MDFRQREYTQMKRPTAPPVNLDEGRLDIRRAAMAGGFTLGALLIAALGAWVATTAYEADQRFIAVVGLGVSLVALGFGGVVLYVSLNESLDHRRRLQDWHEVTLSAWEQQGASETIEKVSEIEMTSDNPMHVLAMALYLHMLVKAGNETPWAVRKLNGPFFLANRRVGDISKGTAEEMGKRLAQLGIIEGRAERSPGRWVPESSDQVVDLVMKRWK